MKEHKCTLGLAWLTEEARQLLIDARCRSDADGRLVVTGVDLIQAAASRATDLVEELLDVPLETVPDAATPTNHTCRLLADRSLRDLLTRIASQAPVSSRSLIHTLLVTDPDAADAAIEMASVHNRDVARRALLLLPFTAIERRKLELLAHRIRSPKLAGGPL